MNPAIRFLPSIIASVLLMAGAARAEAAAPDEGWEETGHASWYGGRHHGRRTTSGEFFDQNALTAAHSSLPLGSRVRVTLQDTGESVVVTINDRQPPKGLRVIDLSRGAASRIGLIRRGTGWVTVQPAGSDEPVEVAEAPEDARSDARSGAAASAVSPRRHGQPRMRRGRPSASADLPCCRAPSATPVRHSAPRRAAPRKL